MLNLANSVADTVRFLAHSVPTLHPVLSTIIHGSMGGTGRATARRPFLENFTIDLKKNTEMNVQMLFSSFLFPESGFRQTF